jgi:ArsR family metal-binding transcriptional regulator
LEDRSLIEKYTISFNYPGCHAGSDNFIADIEVDRDLTDLLPYLNASAENAKYLPKSNWILFTFRGYPQAEDGCWDVAVREKIISVKTFNDNNVAKKICGEVIHYLNDLTLKIGEIKPSYKEWNPPQAIEIYKNLPKTNCQQCGLATCLAFATKLVLEEMIPENCPDLSADPVNYQKIQNMLNHIQSG